MQDAVIARLEACGAVSELSRCMYATGLRTVVKCMKAASAEDALARPKPAWAAIRKKYKNARTRRSLLSAAMAAFKHCEGLAERLGTREEWAAHWRAVGKDVNAAALAGEPTEREQAGWVPWADVVAKEKQLAAADYASPDHVLLAMYSLIEPLRQDFGDLRVLGKAPAQDAGNYLVLRGRGGKDPQARLVLHEYKTAKRYGALRRELPPPLAAVLAASLKRQPRSHVFLDSTGKPFKANSFTQHTNRCLRRLFGRRCSVSLLRHAYISALDFNAQRPGELFEKARNMGHSIGMQQMYRRVVEPARPAK